MAAPLFLGFQPIRHLAQFSDAKVVLAPSSPRLLDYLPVTDADQMHCQDQ